jgi:hypothetical protein
MPATGGSTPGAPERRHPGDVRDQVDGAIAHPSSPSHRLSHGARNRLGAHGQAMKWPTTAERDRPLATAQRRSAEGTADPPHDPDGSAGGPDDRGRARSEHGCERHRGARGELEDDVRPDTDGRDPREGPARLSPAGPARRSKRGRCRIRTCEGILRRIYSPLPLAARATCRSHPGCSPAQRHERIAQHQPLLSTARPLRGGNRRHG